MMSLSIAERVLYAFLFFAVPFLLSVGFVLPFVAVRQVKDFAASASSDIRGL